MLATLTAAGFVVDAHTLEPAELPEPTRRRLDRETAALALPGRDRVAAHSGRHDPAPARRPGAGHRHQPTRGADRLQPRLGRRRPRRPGPDRSHPARRRRARPACSPLTPTARAASPRPRRSRRVAPDVEVTPLRPARATFAVLVGFAAPAALTALSYGRRRLAHLAVSRPGRHGGGRTTGAAGRRRRA